MYIPESLKEKIEAEADDLAMGDNSHLLDEYGYDETVNAYKAGLEKGAELALEDAQNGWISVEDDLPGDHQNILMFFAYKDKPGGIVEAITFTSGEEKWFPTNGATHWMELPLPPLPTPPKTNTK